jgi:hypothetical protein
MLAPAFGSSARYQDLHFGAAAAKSFATWPGAT